MEFSLYIFIISFVDEGMYLNGINPTGLVLQDARMTYTHSQANRTQDLEKQI